ncbi:molecular chaperone DnaK [Geomonas silvestris]|uniref:Molecular chaperone DnaK n=1 Tax=Geomonas silvestris TaxID=2740184 RepID=A0A6V8MN20_9BACT|nr:TraR/DksA C4-type zinc finger protein [Geomonas silvestris]GFO61435.1 molecular chaperone DnaK [Geomonas silvestris]
MPEKSDVVDLEQRKVLMEQKRRLWAELREEIFTNAGEELHTQYEIPQDPGEMSILDLLADAGLAIAEVRRAQLTALEESLRRLEMGTYGVCEGCGERISLERLRVVPFAAFCVACQKDREGPGRPPGVKI